MLCWINIISRFFDFILPRIGSRILANCTHTATTANADEFETNKSREILMSGLIEFTMMIFECTRKRERREEKGHENWLIFNFTMESVSVVWIEWGRKFVDEWLKHCAGGQQQLEFQDDQIFMRNFWMFVFRACYEFQSNVSCTLTPSI